MTRRTAAVIVDLVPDGVVARRQERHPQPKEAYGMTTKTSAEGGAGTRRLSRAVIAGGSAMVLGGAALAAGATPAAASHDHDHPSGPLNSPTWRVCQDDTPTFGGIVAVNWAVALYNSHADLDVARLEGTGSACLSQSGANVFVVDEYWADTMDHFTVCYSPGGPANCHLKVVGLNATLNDAAADPVAQWKKSACHEFGHVAGLGDRSDAFYTGSCMLPGTAPPVAQIPDAHDMDAIAVTY
jgi:hypothetical protein